MSNPFINRFIFFPTRSLTANPAQAGLAYEDVQLVARDGVRLHGWFVPRTDPTATLLFIHGNAGNISHRVEMLRVLHDAGFQVLIFDYRGYGKSEGAPDETGTYLDAQAAWQWLRQHVSGPAVLYGRSLGGAVAAWLAIQEDTQPNAVILESTFTSARDMATRVLPLPGISRLIPDIYPTLQRVSRLKVPVLISHGVADEVIPVGHAHRLYEAANQPKELVLLAGAHHNDTLFVGGRQYLARLKDFLERHAG